jgi:prepilin-type N-terminal cleavage/methylation domain-containing protein
MKPESVRGFTLVELLVVIAIIGVMVAMTIPAVQASRESGRRNLCRNNIAQLLLAMQSYESAFEVFPPGVTNPDGPIRSEPKGLHQGWIIRLLPHLDEQVAFGMVDLSASVYDPANARARDYWPSLFICASEPHDVRGASNYAGCHHDVESPIAEDNNGVLFLNSRIRREDISDGAAHTFLIGEKRVSGDDLGWMSGTRATLRNTGLAPNDPATFGPEPTAGPTVSPTYVGPFASAHSGGVQMGFGDASVQLIADTIDLKVWQQLANRADGSLVDLRFSD